MSIKLRNQFLCRTNPRFPGPGVKRENTCLVCSDRWLLSFYLLGTPRRLSTYIYRDLRRDRLFEPKGVVWNPNSTVHVIVPGTFNAVQPGKLLKKQYGGVCF